MFSQSYLPLQQRKVFHFLFYPTDNPLSSICHTKSNHLLRRVSLHKRLHSTFFAACSIYTFISNSAVSLILATTPVLVPIILLSTSQYQSWVTNVLLSFTYVLYIFNTGDFGYTHFLYLRFHISAVLFRYNQDHEYPIRWQILKPVTCVKTSPDLSGF
jgi:hypothetical protein